MASAALLPIITALAGALVGVLGSELRLSLDAVRQRRRTLNRVLRYQLEVFYSLKRIDPDTLKSEFVSFFEARWPGSGHRVAEALGSFPDLLIKISDTASTTLDPRILSGYESAIESLAEIEPVLAYRLSGIDKATLVRTKLHQLATTIQTAAPESAPAPELIQAVFEPELVRLAQDGIEEDIAKTKPFLSRRHQRELANCIAKLREDAMSQQKDDVEQYWRMMDNIAVNLAALGDTGLAAMLGKEQFDDADFQPAMLRT